MNFASVTKGSCQYIEVAGEDGFVRFGPNNWYRRYGSSLEEEYFSEELEKQYQELLYETE